MNRVQVIYEGQDYLIGDRDAEQVEREIEAVVASGKPGWLTVSYGEGQPTRCRLLLTPGVGIAVAEFPTSSES
ncbi:hypothetical protein [Amnibacterium sp.]|uniref:hypothetical protein n=1 Tax=Amnibacterium sp. TaxID=1872496 RepID=UPI0026318863|nr:hypothetical protein [Amnibacterium sp.]MCU1474658.1 hypothetical protein [Amnibacterium sp.]